MKKLIQKIELINSMIPAVNLADEVPVTYAGGTWPYYVLIEPIEVKNQFVTIRSAINHNSFIASKERYNVNKTSDFGDEFCAKHLNYVLNTILKSFKKVIK
jgi:hypothetical protein